MAVTFCFSLYCLSVCVCVWLISSVTMNSQKSHFVCVWWRGCTETKSDAQFTAYVVFRGLRAKTCAGDTHMWTDCTCPVHNKSGLHNRRANHLSVGSIAASRDTFRNVFESVYMTCTFRQITITLTTASVAARRHDWWLTVTRTVEVRREANVSTIYRVIGRTFSDEQKVRLCNFIRILFAIKFFKIIRPVLG
jgi:hypothetical protein